MGTTSKYLSNRGVKKLVHRLAKRACAFVLKQQGVSTRDVFESRTATRRELHLSCHYHLFIAKYLSSIRDDWVKNLGDTTVRACEMFISGYRPQLKNVAYLNSLVFQNKPLGVRTIRQPRHVTIIQNGGDREI